MGQTPLQARGVEGSLPFQLKRRETITAKAAKAYTRLSLLSIGFARSAKEYTTIRCPGRPSHANCLTDCRTRVESVGNKGVAAVG